MITLRPAKSLDTHMVFQWRNRVDIIQNSTLNKSVTWLEHSEWFSGMLSAPSQAMYIIENPDPIGQVRFDQLEGHVCSVSIYLLPKSQGMGYGVEALKQSCAEISSTWTMPILAFIRKGNRASEKAFGKAGFTLSDLHEIPDHVTLEYAP